MTQPITDRSRAIHHLPEPDSGLTCLQLPRPRSASFHQFAIASLPQQGITYWVDAASIASTYTLYDLAPSERWLSGLRIARAFTAYQHFSLAQDIVNRVSSRTARLLVPNVTRLYRDDDVPDHEAVDMLGAVVQGLGATAEHYDLPVVVSVSQSDELSETVLEAADHVIACEETRLGHRFHGDGIETTAYWDDGYWQTMIPYWVELCGAVDEGDAIRTAEAFGIEGVA